MSIFFDAITDFLNEKMVFWWRKKLMKAEAMGQLTQLGDVTELC